MERVLGPQVGEHLRRLHERNGVVFHFGERVSRDQHSADLRSGRYRARRPDPLTGDHIRVEHWVVADLGGTDRGADRSMPFFWTTQYDFALNYVGHAESWESTDLDGSIEEHDAALIPAWRGRHSPWPLSDATARAWKASSPWRELSRLVKPDNPLRHIAAARKEVHYVGIYRITRRCCSTRGDHVDASRPGSGFGCSRQGNRSFGYVSRFSRGARCQPGGASTRASVPNRNAFLQLSWDPDVHDGIANARALAVKFQLPDGKNADILALHIEAFRTDT